MTETSNVTKRQMPLETAIALRGSIEKWQKIVDGKGIDRGYMNCPLCELFNKSIVVDCVGCPVKAKVNNDGCAGTPYINFYLETRRIGIDIYANQTNISYDFDKFPQLKTLAQAELDFLLSIWPVEQYGTIHEFDKQQETNRVKTINKGE